MFDFEFTGASYGDDINHGGAVAAAETKAAELLGPDWKSRLDQISAAFRSDDWPPQSDQEIWTEIENAATFAAFAGWSEIPDNMSLVWR